MALASSGSISIGGSTSGRSINLELGRSASASSNLNESALRSLANRSSGSVSLSHFHGKSNVAWSFNITNGNHRDSWCLLKSCNTLYHQGYANYWDGFQLPPSSFYSASGYGSTTDTTCNFKSGATMVRLKWASTIGAVLVFGLAGNHTNAGFTSLKVHNTTFLRTDATHTYDSTKNHTNWQWSTAAVTNNNAVATNPFTTGTNAIVFT